MSVITKSGSALSLASLNLENRAASEAGGVKSHHSGVAVRNVWDVCCRNLDLQMMFCKAWQFALIPCIFESYLEKPKDHRCFLDRFPLLGLLTTAGYAQSYLASAQERSEARVVLLEETRGVHTFRYGRFTQYEGSDCIPKISNK